MGTTSAAEARLAAAVRPDIAIVRSRSSYPRRVVGLPRPAERSVAERAGVADQAGLAEVVELGTRRPAIAPPVGRSSASRVRLTRRGRIVMSVCALVATVVTAVALWLALASRAQASSSFVPGNWRSALTRVVVRPGQTLWAIALQVQPSADPRVVVQQIADINSLHGDTITPGETLWVPRG